MRAGKKEFGKDASWEHTIRDEEDYAAHMDYCHINPVKHGYVTRVRDWKFSTFHYHVTKDNYPIHWAGGFEDDAGGGERV